jgi:hypothetical protein
MPSQLEYLKESLARLEAKPGGSDNPFVQGLRMQIASLEKPRAENPMSNESRWSAGMRPAPEPPKKA